MPTAKSVWLWWCSAAWEGVGEENEAADEVGGGGLRVDEMVEGEVPGFVEERELSADAELDAEAELGTTAARPTVTAGLASAVKVRMSAESLLSHEQEVEPPRPQQQNVWLSPQLFTQLPPDKVSAHRLALVSSPLSPQCQLSKLN